MYSDVYVYNIYPMRKRFFNTLHDNVHYAYIIKSASYSTCNVKVMQKSSGGLRLSELCRQFMDFDFFSFLKCIYPIIIGLRCFYLL